MIKSSGPADARIMLIGEAPGEKEEEVGLPFVGPSGRVLDGILRDAGIKRENCYITNVVMERPPNNDFGKFYKDKLRKVPSEELKTWHRLLQNEIDQINPNVIVALGEEAMRAVTDKSGISNWRGSVVAGYNGYKVIPTFHPAAIAREWTFRPAAVCDLSKALKESWYPEIKSTERTLEIKRDFKEAVQILKELRSSPYVAFDIETESDQVTAIAFSPSNRPNWAVCIPFWFGISGSLWPEDQENAIWYEIRRLLADHECGKIAHNGSYDIEFLQRTMGLVVNNFCFDTILGMHALYLELPKNLAFAVSIYTDHSYYKDQIKSSSMDDFFIYNATDACLTMEIACKLMEELKSEKLGEFYQNYLQNLVEPLIAMQLRGVRFDEDKRDLVKDKVKNELIELQSSLDTAVGKPINTNSPLQMKRWLYGKVEDGGIGLKEKTKKRKDTGEITVAADEEAIQALYAETKIEALQTVLQIRERKKLLSTYLEVKLDPDRRIRCSYNITGTETGRLSSSGTLRGTGTNLQNIPSGIVKTLFIADEEKVFINADLSQAEARVVAYLANETRLIRIFEEGGDIHRKNASNIFGISEDMVSDEQRQLAKKVIHASNYGMGPLTFAKTAGITVPESKRLLNQYFATYPNIYNWQLNIQSILKRKRYLVNPFGRKRHFFSIWEDKLFKEGLAYIPQSTVADIVTGAIIDLHKEGHELLLQVHDSILVQCRKEDLEYTVDRIRIALKRPVEINGKVLVIPTDIKVGYNWEDLKKFNPTTSIQDTPLALGV